MDSLYKLGKSSDPNQRDMATKVMDRYIHHSRGYVIHELQEIRVSGKLSEGTGY
jgi:hypothetical protein